MAPGAIGLSKQVIRALRTDEARRIARRPLRARTSAEVEQVLHELQTAADRN
jgi:hypothetical protein